IVVFCTSLSFFFFFQAEDGIRDFHVTGVQTCALPISAALTAELRKVHQFVTFTSPSFIQYAIADFMGECPEHALELPEFYQAKRSEERRVGKECRNRCST